MNTYPEIREAYAKAGELPGLVSTIETQKDTTAIKLAVLSLSIGDRPYSKLTKARLEEYCRNHGYHLHYYTSVIDENYTLMWQRVPGLRKLLNQYEAVFWFDDDIYITNMNIKLESFLGDHSIVFSADSQCEKPEILINSGIYGLKSDNVSKAFIENVIEGYDYFSGYYKDKPLYEQSIITYLYYERWSKHITVYEPGLLQSFISGDKRGLWTKDKFCLHLNEISLAERLRIFSKLDTDHECSLSDLMNS